MPCIFICDKSFPGTDAKYVHMFALTFMFQGQSYKMDTEEEEEEEEAEGGSDPQINGGSDRSSELVTADPLVKNSGHGSCQSRYQ